MSKGSHRDRRYGTLRWRRTSDAVLGKTKHQRVSVWQCWVPNCYRQATCADHVIPVSPEMPDSLFYARHNLRPSCWHHNIQKGFTEAFERDTNGEPARPSAVGGPPGRVITFRSKPRIG